MDEDDFPYAAETAGIVVKVAPEYLEADSAPDDGQFIWKYTVQIVNRSDRALQLIDRRWVITDVAGRRSEVSGEGVVGEQPRIEPGDSYTYSSGCPLREPSGLMMGQYGMKSDDGDRVEISVPAFSLDSPYDRARRH